jgi:hypothetical protein
MLVYFFPQVLSLLLLPIASSFPLGVHSALDELSKRLDKPAVPSASDLLPRLRDPQEGRCLFYTGGTLTAASQYAEDNSLSILGDLDKDGWAAPSDRFPDEDGEDDYNPECPMSWAFQKNYLFAGAGWEEEDRNKYFDNLSGAFAQKCNGDILLAIPPSKEIPQDSVFYRVEWPVIKANPAIKKLSAVVLKQGEGADGAPLSKVSLIWSRCESTEN